jgi:hypothetical protein
MIRSRALLSLLLAVGVTISSSAGDPAVSAAQGGAAQSRPDALDRAASPPAAPTYSPWSPPVNLGPPFNSELEESAPMISKDDLSFYFNSPRPGGLGNEDIYVSRRSGRDQPWGPSANLGPRINTEFNDRIPTLSRDGHWLFFSSNRPGGLGGNDIWVSWRADPNDDFGWRQPTNPGAPINSTANDEGPFYFANDDIPVPRLYFASNRPGGIGGFDIYVSQGNADGSFGPVLLVGELSSPQNDARPNVRQDGLEVFIHSNRVGSVGEADLWVSTRETLQSAWSTPVNLGAPVNSASNDRQPALSSDHLTLLFASGRPGGLGSDDLYMTIRTR